MNKFKAGALMLPLMAAAWPAYSTRLACVYRERTEIAARGGRWLPSESDHRHADGAY